MAALVAERGSEWNSRAEMLIEADALPNIARCRLRLRGNG
jgi:hypothetical protein